MASRIADPAASLTGTLSKEARTEIRTDPESLCAPSAEHKQKKGNIKEDHQRTKTQTRNSRHTGPKSANKENSILSCHTDANRVIFWVKMRFENKSFLRLTLGSLGLLPSAFFFSSSSLLPFSARPKSHTVRGKGKTSYDFHAKYFVIPAFFVFRLCFVCRYSLSPTHTRKISYDSFLLIC